MGHRRTDTLRYAALVGLIVLAALAIRAGLAWTAVAVSRDAAGKYLPLAQAWQQGQPAKAFAGGLPPLYPIVTGLLGRMVGDVEAAGRLVSIAGGMLVLLFVFLLAYRLAGRWTACVALTLVAFHPYLCEFSADVGPDSLAAGLLAGLVYAVCAYLLTFSFRNILLAAGAMAGLALTRPEGFAYAPLALVVMLFWPVRRTGDAETRRRGDAEIRRRQGPGFRGQKSEVRSQRSEVGSPRAVVSGNAEDAGCHGSFAALETGSMDTALWPRIRAVKEDRIGTRSLWRRRAVHVGLLLLILAGLCVPRLISVHRQTGVWALDTRQRTWTTRIWSALRSGQPQYGQWRIWSRGGWQAVGETVGSTVAGFGPAAMVFGVYGLIAGRRLGRRRVAMVIVLFVVYSYLLILVGNRINKRYLLGPAALWQVWGAIGIVLLFLRVRVLVRKRQRGRNGRTEDWELRTEERPQRQRERNGKDESEGVRPRRLCQGIEGPSLRRAWAAFGRGGRGLTPEASRLRALPVVAGLVIACLQLPWVPQRLHQEFLADRHMGEWMAANLPAGTRVLAMESVPLWYARAVKVNPPTFKPSRLSPPGLALMAGQAKADYILVDSRGPVWCPKVWGTLEKGDWPYGRILHRQHARKHTLYLLDVSRAQQAAVDQATIDATPRKRRRAPAPSTQSVPPLVRHPKGKRLAAATRPAATRPAR